MQTENTTNMFPLFDSNAVKSSIKVLAVVIMLFVLVNVFSS